MGGSTPSPLFFKDWIGFRGQCRHNIFQSHGWSEIFKQLCVCFTFRGIYMDTDILVLKDLTEVLAAQLE